MDSGADTNYRAGAVQKYFISNTMYVQRLQQKKDMVFNTQGRSGLPGGGETNQGGADRKRQRQDVKKDQTHEDRNFKIKQETMTLSSSKLPGFDECRTGAPVWATNSVQTIHVLFNNCCFKSL